MFTKVLSGIAPALGALFGFPKVGQAVNEVLGLTDKSTEAERKKAIQSMSNKQRAELARINKMYESKLASIDHKNNELIVKDTQSARLFAKQTKSLMPAAITWALLVMWVSFGIYLLQHPPLMHIDLVDATFGNLTIVSIGGSILNFWFGSKFHSKTKDK